jgi:hypothetical protein
MVFVPISSSNVSDFDRASPEFKERYARETRIILKNLGRRRKLTKNQKRLIKEIRKKINQ